MDYWWSQFTKELMSWKDGIDPSIVPNPNDLCQQGKLKKEPSGRSNHVNMQQRCSLLDKKLKKIEGVNDLGIVDPRELCLVPDLVIPPGSKCQNLKSTMEPNALRTIWPCIVTRWQATLAMKICWSMCSSTVWLGQQLNGTWDWRGIKFILGEI